MTEPTLEGVFEKLIHGSYTVCHNCDFFVNNLGFDDEEPFTECTCEHADQCTAASIQHKLVLEDYNYDQENA